MCMKCKAYLFIKFKIMFKTNNLKIHLHSFLFKYAELLSGIFLL